MMNVVSLCFGPYERLARVLQKSIEQNSPATPLTIVNYPNMGDDFAKQVRGVQRVYRENAFKTKVHSEIVNNAPDGELLCLMDCDMLVLRDLSPMEQEQFDLCITTRSAKSNYPFNTGVVFVRVSEKTKKFYRDWFDTVMKLVASSNFFRRMSMKYGRINQCGLGAMLEAPHDLHLLEVPCREWNAVHGDWRFVDEHTRVVHILEPMRKICLNRKAVIPPDMKKIVNIWRTFDATPSVS